MLVRSCENEPPPGWDDRLCSAFGEAGLCQSSYWSRVMKRSEQGSPIFLEVTDEKSRKVLLSLLLIHKIPWDRRKLRRKHSVKDLILSRNSEWLEWLDGPVIYTDSISIIREALTTLIGWIDEYASKRKIQRINCLGFSRSSRYASSPDIATIFQEQGYTAVPWATYVVSLSADEDKLWKKLQSSARKSVLRARKMGVIVKKMDSFSESSARYFEHYHKFKIDAGLVPSPPQVFKISWDEDKEGYNHYFIAENARGEVLATLGMYTYNGISTEISSTLSVKAFSEKIPAQDLLHWEMMVKAREMGSHSFDLAGVSPAPETSKEAGIRRFKEKWGGAYREYFRFHRDLPCRRSGLERALRYGRRLLRASR